MAMPAVIHETIFSILQTSLPSHRQAFLAFRSCCKQLKTSADHIHSHVSFSTAELAEIQPFLRKLTGLKQITIRSTAASDFNPSLNFLSNLLPSGQLTHLSLIGLNEVESAEWSQAQKDTARADLDLTSLVLPWCSGLTHLAITHCLCTFPDMQTEASRHSTVTKVNPDGSSSVWMCVAERHTTYTVLFKHASMLQSLELRHVSPGLCERDFKLLKGLERLTCVASLDTQELEISFQENLQHIDCSCNRLMSLDISHCDALRTLDCSGNGLKQLDICDCDALTELQMSRNRITLLNLCLLSSLQDLDCSHSAVCKMLLPMGTTLRRLNCSQNSLYEPDVFLNRSGLQYLDCSCNRFPKVNLSECSGLLHLNCSNNLLTHLTLANCRGLQRLDCYRNKLKVLSLAAQKALNHLDCSNNSISKLTLSGNISLQHVDCSDNCVQRLDLPKTAALQLLNCASNKLGMLDLSKNTGLLHLHCQLNHLSYLCVGGCRSLQSINSLLNQLPEMDYSSFPYLHQLNTAGRKSRQM